MAEIWAPVAEELAGLDQREPSHILDIGTGSGVWSLAMAQRFPSAHVTGLDFDEVLEAFKNRAADLGLSDRVHTIAGDVNELDLPRDKFDRVVIANVLRLESADRAQALVELAADIVMPGGDLVIMDAWPADSDGARLGFAVYSLNLAIRTGTGKPHAVETIQSWVEGSGLTVTNSTHVGPMARSGALFASKPR